MTEIRGQDTNVLQFPRALPAISCIGLLAEWVRDRGFDEPDPAMPAAWRAMQDDDGTLLLIPLDGPEPGFVVTRCDDEYEVMICDPDDIDEMGPFGSFGAALAGITNWLSLPTRHWYHDDRPAPDAGNFRPAFAVSTPASEHQRAP